MDYENMTSDDFDRCLIDVIVARIEKYGSENTVRYLLQIGDVYTDLAEEFNNDTLDAWTREQRNNG